jgi:hypothetical protein
MSEHLPHPTDPQVAHTEHLLRLLKEVSAQDPPARLRERIVEMSSAQIKPKRLFPVFGWELAKANRWLLIVSTAVAALVIAAILNVIYRPAPPDSLTVRTMTPSAPQVASVSSEALSVPGIRKNLPRRPDVKPASVPHDRLTLLLPYSNADVSTGTTTTVRISIPQTQLIALGLPLPAGTANSRIVADVALGDDGMPRAISLPLPLQVVKEN